MQKFFLFILLSVFFCFGHIIVSAQSSANTLSVGLTDGRKVITRNIDKNLLLRVVKDSSVNQKHFCWMLEVVRKPYRRNSKNLIYTNPTGNTADKSQVCAWQIGEKYFPNERAFDVKGLPYVLNVRLIDPKTKGSESNTGFTSGTLQINWSRK